MKRACHRKHIGIKHPTNVRQILVIFRPRTDRNTRGGNHHIGRAVLGDERARRIVQLGFDRYVRRINFMVLRMIHARTNILQNFAATPDQANHCPFLGVLLCQCCADAAGCAGDKNGKCHDDPYLQMCDALF